MAVNLDINLNDKEVIAQLQKILREAQELERTVDDVGDKGNRSFDKMDKGADGLRQGIGKVVKETDKLERSIEGTGKAADKAEKSQSKLSKTVDKVKDKLSEGKEAFSELGGTILEEVDNVNLFGFSLGNVRQSAGKFLGTTVGRLIGGFAAVGLAAFKAGQAFVNYNLRVAEVRSVTQEITGLTGETERAIRTQATAIEEVLGVDFKRTLNVARSAVNSFGEDYEVVLDDLQKGLIAAGDQQDEFLDSVREYSTFFADAGFSFQEFTSIINEGIDLGIYSDKLPDAIKEFQIAISEQAETASDALENAFGSEFTDKLLGNVRNGLVSTKGALEAIAEESKRVGLNSQQAAQLTADLFKGAGEDAGGALKIFDAVNGALDDQEKQLTELQKAQQANIESLSEYKEAVDRAFAIDGILTFVTEIKNSVRDAFTSILNFVGDVRENISENIERQKQGLEALTLTEFRELKKRRENERERWDEASELIEFFNKDAEEKAKERTKTEIRLTKEQLEAAKKAQQELRKEYAKTIESLQAQAGAVEKALALQDIQDPAERVKKAFEFEKEELEKRRLEVVELARRTGGDVSKVNAAFRVLELAAEREYTNKLKDIRLEQLSEFTELARPEIDQIDIPEPKTTDYLAGLDEIQKKNDELRASLLSEEDDETFFDKARESLSRFTESSAFERLEDGDIFGAGGVALGEALGLSGEDLAQFEQSIVSTFDSIFEGISSGIDAQVAEQDRLIQSIREREEAVKESLETELDRAKEGYANNVDAKRAELEAIKKEEEEAQKKRTELLRKQAKIELAINAAQQGANLATAVSQIFAKTSGIPFVGIALAAAAVASMFSLFQQFKAQSAQAAVTPALHQGGSVRDALDGYVDKGGQNDKHAQGYRVIDNNGRTRLRLGGSEMVMNEMASRGNERFLQELNAGKYKGVDITQSLQASMEPVRVAGQSNNVIVERQGASNYITKGEMEELLKRHAGMLLDFEKRRPQTTIEGDKRVVRKQGRERRVL